MNRVIEWTPNGIKYEADQRHAEIIYQELGLKESSKGVVTPGIKQKPTKREEQALGGREATRYRALVARANYLAQDRPDIGYATKELCREMSKPTIRGMEALKRLGRYLIANPRFVQ